MRLGPNLCYNRGKEVISRAKGASASPGYTIEGHMKYFVRATAPPVHPTSS